MACGPALCASIPLARATVVAMMHYTGFFALFAMSGQLA